MGVFQIDREIFENRIWQDVTEFRLFFWILGNAWFSDEPGKKGNVTISRGQYLRSYRNLIKDLSFIDNKSEKLYALSTVKNTIDRLVSNGRIEKKETELGTLFTVVNYDLYQGFERFKKDNIEQSENSERTVSEQTSNNNKKVKKVKNINMSEIESLWNLYPKKEGKKVFVSKMTSLIKIYGYEQMENTIKRYISSKGKDYEYFKMGSTFANGAYVDYLDENYKEEKTSCNGWKPGDPLIL